MNILTRIIQAIVILIPLVVLGWLGVQNFIPSGTFVVRHSVVMPSSFIDALVPPERVTVPTKDVDGSWFQSIIGDPVFFFVHPHRQFETVDATITFRNTNTPIVEFGALASRAPEQYHLEPLQNIRIDQSTWDRTEENGLTLLQRTRTHESIEDFFLNPPSRDKIATYHSSLTFPFRLPNYVASSVLQTLSVSLRGAHTMKTYVKEEPIQMVFVYSDMNRDTGPDPFSVLVLNEQGVPVASVRAEDDGNISSDNKGSVLKTLVLKTGVLPEGVYKIDLQAHRDIFIRSIQTTQQKMIFLNGVYLGDESGYREQFSPVTFFTESKQLSMKTRHAESVQEIRIGSGKLALTAPYQLMTKMIKDPGLVSVTAEKGDVEVLSDTPIAFTPSQFFRPDPVRFLPHTNLDDLGINYILASYTPPTEKDGWLQKTISFDAQALDLNQGGWKFIFSTSDIELNHGQVDVKSVDFTFHRKPMRWYQNWKQK